MAPSEQLQSKQKLPWRIRAAVPGDATGIKECMQSAYAGYQQRMEGQRLPPMDADYATEIKNYPTWVVESHEVILGALIMVFETDRASLANIAVDPRFQGRGIGGELLQFAQAKAREHDYTELELATHVLLSENISLYRHLGWQETGRDEIRVYMKITI